MAHFPAIWRGAYRSENLLDFHCSRITMSFSQPIPYQIGGEARGERDALTVGLSDYPVEMVDLRSQVAVR
jgi:hypothetical protein